MKRVNKMASESLQLLSTAIRHHVPEEEINVFIWKSAFENHPCSIWTRESRSNFDWLVQHTGELLSIMKEYYGLEYQSRLIVLAGCEEMRHRIPANSLTPFADCTEFKDRLDISIYERYRLFMIRKWVDRDVYLPKWLQKPQWLPRNLEESRKASVALQMKIEARKRILAERKLNRRRVP